jgi:hypothetical protein
MEQFKRGELVEVQFYGDGEWEQRIYIEYVDGAKFPFVCVHEFDENKFWSGQTFRICFWECARPIRPDLKVDDPVIVWNQNYEHHKKKRHFSDWNKDGRIATYNDGQTSWSSAGPCLKTVWDHYELPNKEDSK